MQKFSRNQKTLPRIEQPEPLDYLPGNTLGMIRSEKSERNFVEQIRMFILAHH